MTYPTAEDTAEMWKRIKAFNDATGVTKAELEEGCERLSAVLRIY